MKSFMKQFLSLICLLFTFNCYSMTKIAIIGDSISLPWPELPYLGYPAQLQKQFDDQNYSVRILNASQGGSTAETALSRLQALINYDKPDILIIALGVNDGWSGRTYTQIYHDLKKTIKAAHKAQMQVLLGTVDFIPEQPNYKNDPDKKPYYTQFITIYHSLQQNFPSVISFPFLTQNFQRDKSFHTIDLVHLNYKGHKMIANKLWTLIEPLINKDQDAN